MHVAQTLNRHYCNELDNRPIHTLSTVQACRMSFSLQCFMLRLPFKFQIPNALPDTTAHMKRVCTAWGWRGSANCRSSLTQVRVKLLCVEGNGWCLNTNVFLAASRGIFGGYWECLTLQGGCCAFQQISSLQMKKTKIVYKSCVQSRSALSNIFCVQSHCHAGKKQNLSAASKSVCYSGRTSMICPLLLHSCY